MLAQTYNELGVVMFGLIQIAGTCGKRPPPSGVIAERIEPSAMVPWNTFMYSGTIT